MPLNWNEIKSRALAFTNEWKDEVSEDAEAKSFWDDFFNVFGISRRRVATFEQQVKKLNDKQGFIDLLWKGTILIEHKSRGKDLNKAFQQAKDYFPGLKEKELPRYILVSDFERFNLYDLEKSTSHEFRLADFINNVHLFGFIAGYEKRTYKEQDPVNIEAAALMGKLHDKLEAIGYTGHALELYLVRLLFCLFADDTNIFEKGIFHDYIELRTDEDGSDLANHIAQLFEILNTPKDKRFKNLDESLAAFPYVNGKLFEEHLATASFDSDMRKLLLECCLLDWGKISPAIFGSLFQSVMNPVERRTLGAHYTSEKNILKLIKPLFLDELWKEFESAKETRPKLQKFHDKISRLRFLDPACGCGNFLIIAYRELRLIEIEIVKVLLYKYEKLRPEVAAEAGIYISHLILCDVDRFYGIEYEEFPAQIAQVAMWLIDHQMNQLVSLTFGDYYVRLPLKKSATIKHANALHTDWQSLLIKESTTSIHADKANIIQVEEPEAVYKTVNVYAKEIVHVNSEDVKPVSDIKFDYIFGNPPFSGKSLQNAEQKKDMDLIFAGVKGAGVLDYVTAWYIKAAQYLKATSHIFKHTGDFINIEIEENFTLCAFVSTNSISQGEQVGVLWKELFNKYHINIFFAHRTFKWGNEAKRNAAVHVVIIGFANFNYHPKTLYEYEKITNEPHELKVKNINPYLVEGKNIFLPSRKRPINNVPQMLYGNKIVDGGFYLFTDKEKEAFIQQEIKAKKYFKPLLSGEEFINGRNRWVLYLKDAQPEDIKAMPKILERINDVKKYREVSKKQPTREAAMTPTLFAESRQPETDFLLIPRTSSENRQYIPLGFFSKDFIVNDSCIALPDANNYHFGILSSVMHMTWVKYTAGRLKSDFRYSNSLVYNNFPWPENSNEKQKVVAQAAQNILDMRAKFPEASLADLYDSNTMPPELVKAHQQLDKVVDLCYRSQPFINETKRIEFLFELYDRYTSGLFVKEKKAQKKRFQT